jgi:hypothetical protein
MKQMRRSCYVLASINAKTVSAAEEQKASVVGTAAPACHVVGTPYIDDPLTHMEPITRESPQKAAR